MNKNLLIQAISEILQRNFESQKNSSKKSRADGNDSQSKSEGKYDTRSIEENYLADGFARQAQAAAGAMTAFKCMPLRNFDRTTPIDLSALVQVGFKEESVWFFLAPAAGGTEVEVEGKRITVLSPESPLGLQLLGLKTGGLIHSPAAKILAVE